MYFLASYPMSSLFSSEMTINCSGLIRGVLCKIGSSLCLDLCGALKMTVTYRLVHSDVKAIPFID